MKFHLPTKLYLPTKFNLIDLLEAYRFTSISSAVIMLTVVSCTSPSPKVNTADVQVPPLQSSIQSSIQRTTASSTGALNNDLEPTIYVSQNWTPTEREEFYRLPQGSHIIPLKFAAVLRRPDDAKPFFTSENLARYGFVGQAANATTNPMGLPIGFTVDGAMKFEDHLGHSVENGERMIGVTCALCHTGSFHYNGKALRIDGGQTLANFQNFVRDMDVALKVTREDEVKLERFLNETMQYENKSPDLNSRAKLLSELDEALAVRGEWSNLNDSTHYYGHGYNETSFQHGPSRIDAFDAIFNQVLARDLNEPRNASEATNPVNPPVIWDGPHADFVQWNGLASNAADHGGPIARNIGEVLGVFGHIEFKRRTKVLDGYCTSARRENLEKLEVSVSKLWSPKWPEELLGQLNREKVARGKQLFSQTCAHCHLSIDRTDPNRKVISQLIPLAHVGTDPKFDQNALARLAHSDILQGAYTRLKQGRKLEAVEPAATVLKHAVAGAIAGSVSIITCKDNIDVSGPDVVEAWMNVGKAFISKPSPLQDDEIADEKVRTDVLTKKLSVYKARPLNGIWSSPPFLHNGSVNSLYDLLLPAAERANFYLGCDDFDPIKVGLNCSAEHGGFLFDTSISGNLPVGHDFGPRGDHAEEDRMALLEYLKSL